MYQWLITEEPALNPVVTEKGGREGGKPGRIELSKEMLLLTAPLQRSLMVPSGNRTTTDMRFLVLGEKEGVKGEDLTNTQHSCFKKTSYLLNSRRLSSSYFSLTPFCTHTHTHTHMY